MSISREEVPRPDYGIYNPDVSGKPLLYQAILGLVIVFFISYTTYIILSLIDIFQNSNLSILLNLTSLTLELFIGYYSIIMLLHLAKGFAPIKAPLQPKVNSKDLDDPDNPFVSVLLSCYKEPLSIVKQSLKAALDLNYPTDNYEIVVMEDGMMNDDIKNFCKDHNITHFTRDNRDHFKAGAVNYALPRLKGDYVLFIDADHILEKNIIVNCLSAWRKDTIGVQTRIDFVNMVTFLTRVSAFLQILFFSLLERGRRSSGSAIFAGGAAIFDRSKLLEHGGMNELTIADDTDTAFTLIAEGHRIEYIDTVGAWALVPWDPIHQIRQVWRWFTGITRSFRARWLTIIRGKTSIYTKVDHISTGFLPILTVIGWFMGVIFYFMVINDIELVRHQFSQNLIFLQLIPSATTSLAGITGVIALWLDNPDVLYKQGSTSNMVVALVGYYLLLVAAQPLLIGAVFKGLTGIHVEFNRTPKQKQSTDDNLTRVKLQYSFYTIIIFIIGLLYLLVTINLPFGSPLQTSLSIVTYSSVLPLLIAIIWFWKLESYLLEVGDISALEFLEDISTQNSK